MIEDARSFYNLIKANPLYSEIEDQEVVKTLDDKFGSVYRAANEDGRAGIGRDRYLYFQGMLHGLYIGWRQWRHHLEVSAALSGIDPNTGEPIKVREV